MKTLLTTLLISFSFLVLAQDKTFKVNDQVEILSKGKWYPGKVLEVKDNGYLIHYDNYGSNWDEVVGNDRIKAPGAPDPTINKVQSTTGTVFSVGDLVEGNWLGKGKWYKGKIGKIDGEKYFIQYNDGDTEWTTAEFIKSQKVNESNSTETSSSNGTSTITDSPYQIGDKVEANYYSLGNWIEAELVEIKENKACLVRYESGYEEWLDADDVRPIVEEEVIVYEQKFNEGDIVEVLEKDKWEQGTVARFSDSDGMYYVRLKAGWTTRTTEDKIRFLGWPENTCSNKNTLFKEGEKIDVMSDKTNVWYDAIVKEAKDGQYLIHYVGYEDNYDEVVNNDRARKWTGEKEKHSYGNSNSSNGSDKSTITLKNNCSQSVVMYVNYERYSISSGYTVDVEITGDVDVYTEIGGTKKLVGKASVGGTKKEFNSICN